MKNKAGLLEALCDNDSRTRSYFNDTETNTLPLIVTLGQILYCS